MARLFWTALLFCALVPSSWASDQATITRDTIKDGELSLAFSSPVVYRTERFHNDNRLVINLYSVRPDDGIAREISHLKAPWLDHVTSEVILGDSLRFNLYLKANASLNVYGVPPTEAILITPRRHSDAEMNGLGSDETRAPAGAPSTGSETPSPAPSDGHVKVDRLNFENGGSVCRLQCSLDRAVRPQAFLLMTDHARPRLVFDLPNAKIEPAEQTIAVPDNPLISRIRTGVFDHTVARVVLDLKQKVNFGVSTDAAGTQVVLSMVTPGMALNTGDAGSASGRDVGSVIPGGSTGPNGIAPSTEAGALAGRTIVIDPGHGGHDKGTSGYGLLEKDVALDISRRLYTLLKNAGVKAVLTRDDDTFLKLPDRPAIANQLGADAFVAIHLNSTGSEHIVWSGTETYFHFEDPICRELARQVQAQVCQAIGLPDRGARSDTTIAKRLGFSVLRNSQVPAILVEVGYLNHPGDAAKLGNPEFRERAAEGIMGGLRAFFGLNQQSAQGR